MGAGCGGGVGKPADQVSVRLKWAHEAQFAGFYAADQKGFYAEENIAVTQNPGGLEYDEALMVASGQDDFGIVVAEEVLAARGKGIPLVTIAVIYRKNPSVFFTLKESGIKKPVDFIGKKVAVNPDDFQLPAMMARLGIDMAQFEAVPPDYSMDAFFAGEVDVWEGYLTSQVLTAREKGYELNIIYPDDYGIHVYGDSIVTTERMIEENPDLVERFLRATLRGWYYAIENPAEAVDMTLQYDPLLDRNHQMRMMETQTPLIHTGEAEIGRMEDSVWQQMHQMLLDGGVLAQPINISEAYTTQFLNKIYGRTE